MIQYKYDTSMESEKFLLKDHLFNKTKVSSLAREIKAVYPTFKKEFFIKEATRDFDTLELKARIHAIRSALRTHLPTDYRTAVGIILRALPKPLDPKNTDNDFGDFIYAPYGDFVAHYGNNKKDLFFSLRALKEITKRFSCEDAIRYFLNSYPDETLTVLATWVHDTNYHVRRLCSEGTRPKLPWSQKISIPVHAPLFLLDELFYDNTRYVTRSVANHLNDIAKTDPDTVLETLTRWQKSGKQNQSEMDFIIKHATRTLIKQGNQKAFRLLGFDPTHTITLSRFVFPDKVSLNQKFYFMCTCVSSQKTQAIIDYQIFFQNKSGQMRNKKVFKLKKVSLDKNILTTLEKTHILKTNMTTRTFYTGVHQIDILVNGNIIGTKQFIVE